MKEDVLLNGDHAAVDKTKGKVQREQNMPSFKVTINRTCMIVDQVL